MQTNFVIDEHAHASGSFLTESGIRKLMNENQVDMLFLTPAQLGSKITYPLKNKARRDPYGDVVSGNNRLSGGMIRLIGAIKQIPEGNERVYQLCRQMPECTRQIYWVTRKNVSQLDEDYERMGFIGIKLHQCWEYFDISSNWFENVINWAGKKDLPVFIHVYTLVEMRKLIGFIKEHQEATIIIAHLYGLESFMEEPASDFENIWFDISNCYFVSKERIEMACRWIGADKLLFGSDTPYGIKSQKLTKDMVEKLDIPEGDKAKILGGNAARLFEIQMV
ncbi:MAG: TatD family hydrolase [Lachnospiraceae bacterium]|nr:TatD family hydrolase [Lachnospiraceae bacterium]